jgi:hypothetical protein
MIENIQLAADDAICEALCEIPEDQAVEYLIALIECAISQLKLKMEIPI